ncbi:MAG: 3-phosphoshikimate 1-carboxyvinyltransferase [Kiritimatiellia bacterium]|nr:3-phosphoshikimate 1-carboxyvinyltransferase [Lentisphaerota bacterium]
MNGKVGRKVAGRRLTEKRARAVAGREQRATLARVHPCSCLSGVISLPGDKSISHRLAMLAALAQGESRLRNFLRSEDCLNTVKALEALGAGVVWKGDELRITGGPWKPPKLPLDMGNSGTGMRLLAGLLAARPWRSVLTGDASLCSRPMERIRAPLEMMGARVELQGRGGCAPLAVQGGNLHGVEYRMPMASAQVKSCVLLAGLFAKGHTTVWEPSPTRDHTELILQSMGVPVEVSGLKITLKGYGPAGPELPVREWMVPGDFSAAAFWLVAAGAMPEASVSLPFVGLNQRRSVFLKVLQRMGAQVKVTHIQDPAPEPLGEVVVRGATLRGVEVGGDDIPGMIDELPLLAVTGALACGETVIRDAAELRAKESDRIACMAANLRASGVKVEEAPDGMRVTGGAVKGGVRVPSFGDHRVAMAMAVLAVFAEKPLEIENIGCVRTSYPNFWQHLRSLGVHVELSGGD